jgi:uracil-DNA glycosylase family 4
VPERGESLAALGREIVSCRRCPRLVEWREKVAREKRAAFSGEDYWGRPVPGFGDPGAKIVILGLAPAAHGANRTGRYFTGDRSGDFLFAALHRTGLANRPVSRHREDGLRLCGAWISASVRCAPPQNKPTPAEREACLPYAARELELLGARVVICLGAFAWDGAQRALRRLGHTATPRPRFGHAAEAAVKDGPVMLASFHPSQQNTFTGKLTEAMMDAVFLRARKLAGSS